MVRKYFFYVNFTTDRQWQSLYIAIETNNLQSIIMIFLCVI